MHSPLHVNIIVCHRVQIIGRDTREPWPDFVSNLDPYWDTFVSFPLLLFPATATLRSTYAIRNYLNLLVIFRTSTIRIGKFLRDTARRTASFGFYLSKVAFQITMRHKYFTKSKISMTRVCRRFKIWTSDSRTQDFFHHEKRLSSIKLALSYCKDRKYDVMFTKKLEL